MPRTAGPVLTAVGLALAATAARAHGAEPHGNGGWSFDPLIGGLLVASAATQVVGSARMGPARATIAPAWRRAAYWAAAATVVLALFSPIDARADSSFAWHMLQHLLLMLVAAPLLALSNAHFVALYAFPLATRRRIGQAIGLVPGARQGTRHALAPWLAALAFAGGLWLWHAPVMYEAALGNRWIHSAEHLVFLFTAAIFWRMVATAGNRRLGLGTSVLLVTLVGLQGNLMAALITLSPTPLYLSYAGPGGLADQQWAGLMMWIPAGLIYLASTVFALRRLIR
ncbi:MAG TPA: cytochrome c oxidase assembly protein [Thermomonas sp.]|nr:cytochrome c oxidase assembly protein [Thermomonas sp.]